MLYLWSVCIMLSSLAIPISDAAEEPRIQLAVDSEEVFVGESITLQVIVHNVESPDTPDVSALDADFHHELQATQPMSSSSVVIINGRMTTQQELKTVFQYQLTPKRSGSLTISSIKVVADGREFSSDSLTVQVVQPEPQEFVIAETQTSPTSVYPTQTFDVTLQVLVRALPENERDPLQPLRRNPPALTIPWIESHEGLKGPEDVSRWLGKLKSDRGYGFSINSYRSNDPFDFGFGRPSLALFDLANGVVERELQDGTTAKFYRYKMTMKFQATRSGTFTFGPASVKGMFVTEATDGEYRGKKIAVTATPVSVTVKDVPESRPQQFIGGIGRFQASAAVTPNQPRVGDPMTFTLTFTSTTPEALDLVAAPDLRQCDSFSQDFEIIDHAPVGRLEGRNKQFIYGIRPNKKRDEIPSLTFYSFDPEVEQFVEFNTNSIPLQMQDASALSSSEIVGTNQETRKAIKADQSGIFQGTAEMYPLSEDGVSVRHWVGAAGLSWLFSLAGAWFIRMRSQPGTRSPIQRLGKAKGMASERLAEARGLLQQGKVAEARRHLRQALVGLVAATSERSSEGLTTQNVLEQLSRTNLDAAKLRQLQQILESIDASQYGGATQGELQSDLERASELIEPIAQALKSTSTDGRKLRSLTVLSLAVFCCWMPTEAVASQSSNDYQARFQSAVQAMNSAQTPEQFAEAARRLDGLEDAGIQSGALHFHAGNAWFRAGEFGRAIRHYRLAKFYLPRDAYLQSNLEQALRMAPGKFAEQSSTSLGDKVVFWTHWLSHSSKIRLASIAMILSSLCFVLSVRWRDPRPLVGTLGLALLGFGMYVDAYFHSPHAYSIRQGVICTETTARKGMGTEYPAAFDQPLQDGAEFEVLQRTSTWTLGRFPKIGDGWISNQAIAQRSSSETPR